MNGSKSLTIFSPAKINLFLEIVDKRRDHFHELESIMQTVSLYDTLRLTISQRDISIVVTGDRSILPKDNLAYRAAKLLKKVYNVKRGVNIKLHKQIPIGAGLGGGSSNAAATILALNCLWNLRLTKNEMVHLALQLGSDIPFFIYGKTALVKGRGEIIFPVPVKKRYHYLIVNPEIFIPTKSIYTNLKFPLTGQRYNIRYIIERLLSLNISCQEFRSLLFNRLESVALKLYPVLENAVETFRNLTPKGILLSGSGSSFFKLCSDESEAKKLAKRPEIQKLGRIFVVTSLN